jgi:F-type H+-transporting ATPase subunit b
MKKTLVMPIRCVAPFLLAIVPLGMLAVSMATARSVQAAGASAGHASEKTSESGLESSPIPLSWEAVKKDLALWTAVVFVMLFLLLAKFVWKPLAQGLDKREQGIADQIAQAEQANREAKEQLAAYEKRLSAAGEEVRGIIAQGRREAEHAGQELIEKARGEAKAEQERSLRQIEAAETAALKNLADRGASLALELAGKIVHAKLSRKEHEALIEQAVSQFTQRN